MNARLIKGVAVALSAIVVVACSSEDTEGTGGGGSGAGSSSSSSSSSGGTSSNDPFAAARVACVDKINTLRATKGLPALARWTEAEACVDQQAEEDALSGQAHGAWSSGKYTCNGHGQNECPGWGAEGIESCLDSMWAEKDQAGCAGCDACADAYNPSCPGCDFYGSSTGMVCGHYINMSAKYHTRVACGFSTTGGWDAINFE